MSILKNAIDSIAIGLEDYSSPDQRRVISCTRNLFAGILLLFKHKLSVLSPVNSDEVLIKQRVLPVLDNDQLEWTGKGNKTVDVQGIKDRLESLDIRVDWKRIEKINNFRNDIEHYYSDLKHEAIRSLISDCFIIINDFIRNHLEEDPKELLGEAAWTVLIEVNEVYEREKAECTAALQNLEFLDEEILNAFKGYSCDICGSGLIKPSDLKRNAENAEYICQSCGREFLYEEIVSEALMGYYSFATYLSHTDGEDTPLVDCPECGEMTYLYEKSICASCGYVAEHQCQRCGSPILPEELSSKPFCGYCAHAMSKND